MFQHEAGCAAFEDAQKQMDNIVGKIKAKTARIANIQSDVGKNQLEALEARKLEQVCVFVMTI